MVSYDVRAVANFVLDCADQRGIGVSNLSINKIIFFLHCRHLVIFRKPLVSAKIEAWQFGPVFREVYHAFKANDASEIKSRVTRVDPESGSREICKAEFAIKTKEFLREEVPRLLCLSAAELVAWSHQKGGAWDQVWNHEGSGSASMRISDSQILAWFEHSKRH